VIEVEADGFQRFVLSGPTATNAIRREVLHVASGYVWCGGDWLAFVEADGLYGLSTKHKFVATDESWKPSYLDGPPLYLRFERVNGGIRIGSDNHPAIAKFKRLAGCP
jgi:hypothetical protein